MATAPRENFGWFAYVPLSDAVLTSGSRFSLPLVPGGRQLLSFSTVVIGLVLAGLAAGIRLGRGSRR
ncbi:hypothetical protein GCM10027456_63200 [Kineosporia babensis]